MKALYREMPLTMRSTTTEMPKSSTESRRLNEPRDSTLVSRGRPWTKEEEGEEKMN